MIPETTTRVAESSPDWANEMIRQRTEARIAFTAASGPDAIEHRLRELDEEWDIERTLEANAGVLGMLGALMAVTGDRRWALLPAAVGGFLFQHAIQGWCPPIEVFRRLGVRTATEINRERMALKALRGDFQAVPRVHEAPGNRLAEPAVEAATG